MASISLPTATLIAGGVSAAGGVASSLIGGSKAAGGSQQSQYLQALEMNQNIANNAPFIGAGQYATNALQAGLQSGQYGTPMDLSGMPTAAQVPQYTGGAPPPAPAPFVWNPTMEGLAQTPGYQFTLDQGLRATQSAAAAKGLGMSGAAMRGAADYATGKASETYNQQLTNALNINTQGLNLYGKQLAGFGAGLDMYGKQLAGYQAQGAQFQSQFEDYWKNQANPFGLNLDLAKLGQAAAANQAVTGTDAAKNIGGAAQAAGQYQGAGLANAGNALSNFTNSAGFQDALSRWFGNSDPGSPAISGVNTQSLVPATSAMVYGPNSYYSGGSGGSGY